MVGDSKVTCKILMRKVKEIILIIINMKNTFLKILISWDLSLKIKMKLALEHLVRPILVVQKLLQLV